MLHQPLADLVADGEGRVQRGHRLLEDHRDARAAIGPPLRRWKPGQFGPGELDAAGGDPPRRLRNQPHHGERGHALAAAGLADKSQGLAAFDRQIDAIDRPHDAGIGLKLDFEPLDREQRVGHVQARPAGLSPGGVALHAARVGAGFEDAALGRLLARAGGKAAA